MQQFSANGKLLLSGEYVVLDGAKALAIPTQRGQRMSVKTLDNGDNKLHWSSFTNQGTRWINASIDLKDPALSQLESPDKAPLDRLHQLIAAAQSLNPDLLPQLRGKSVETYLDFPQNWGLGSSSTLIWMLAKWWQVDPFELLAATFGGSGYDLACAGVNQAIFYWKDEAKKNHWELLDWQPEWVKDSWFVHLNQKQNSREGIKRYRSKVLDIGVVREISACSSLLQSALLLRQSREIVDHHEALISNLIELPTVKSRLFPDFPGSIKSLGAWGGDFVWALPMEGVDVVSYFKNKGYETVIPWEEMVKQPVA